MLNIHWKDWCWSWNSNTLATWCKELTHWKRPWFWERFKGGGKGDDRGWDGWMASLTLWTWVWANSGSWWWIGKHGILHSMGSQRVRHDWATELSSRINHLTFLFKLTFVIFLFSSIYVSIFIWLRHVKNIAVIRNLNKLFSIWWLSDKKQNCLKSDVGLIHGSGRSLEEEMATHSSILAQEIPWTEKPGGLQSMESQNSQT